MNFPDFSIKLIFPWLFPNFSIFQVNSHPDEADMESHLLYVNVSQGPVPHFKNTLEMKL